MSSTESSNNVSVSDVDKGLLNHVNHLETLVDSIVYQLINTTTNLKTLNVYQIIVNVMEIVEKFEATKIKNTPKDLLVMSIINRLAIGLDGIQGTDDDFISASTRESLVLLIHNKLLSSFITTIIKASKGAYNLNKNKKWCCLK